MHFVHGYSSLTALQFGEKVMRNDAIEPVPGSVAWGVVRTAMRFTHGYSHLTASQFGAKK